MGGASPHTLVRKSSATRCYLSTLVTGFNPRACPSLVLDRVPLGMTRYVDVYRALLDELRAALAMEPSRTE